MIGQPLWDDPLARVARMFPDRAVVLMSPDLAPTHIPTSLAYLHDVDAILVQRRNPGGRVLRRVIGDWLARGRPVFLVVGRERAFVLRAGSGAGRDRRDAGRPPHPGDHPRHGSRGETVRTAVPLRFFQVTGTIDRDRAAVDVGTPAVDLLYDLRGFHASERDGDASGDTFRWTGPRAFLTLPAGGSVTLVVAGARPPGAPPAEIAVSVGERVLERRVVARGRQTIRLDLPETGAAGPIYLEIESTTFQPRAFGSSPDPRELGVRLYGVLVHPFPARPAP